MPTMTVLVTEVHPGEGESVANALSRDADCEVVAYAQDGLDAAQLAYRVRPDAAVLWADLPGLSGLEVCEIISRTAPEVAPVLVVRGDATSLRQTAMMAGARVVVSEDDLSGLGRTLQELRRIRQQLPSDSFAAVTDTQKAPMVVSVVGGKGGIGKTTLAVNLATLLSRRQGEKVALMEMPGQLSDGSVFLDLAPKHGLLSLTDVSAFDADFVVRLMQPHDTGLHYLAVTSDRPSEDLSRLPLATLEMLGQVVGALKRRFTAVVVDCALALWPLASYVLRRSHVVLAVSTLEDMVSLRGGLLLRDLLASAGVDMTRVMPVLNKVQRGSALSVEDYARVTGWDHPVLIPDDSRACAAAVNEGMPVVLRSPGSPVVEALSKLSQEIARTGRSVASEAAKAPVAAK